MTSPYTSLSHIENMVNKHSRNLAAVEAQAVFGGRRDVNQCLSTTCLWPRGTDDAYSPDMVNGVTYSVLCPDPCENPCNVVVDLSVHVDGNPDLTIGESYQKFIYRLFWLGRNMNKKHMGLPHGLPHPVFTDSGLSASPPSFLTERQTEMETDYQDVDTITFNESSVTVHQHFCSVKRNTSGTNPFYTFHRRITLRKLADIILDTGLVRDKALIFDYLFDIKPVQNKQLLIDWFYKCDTYSKCLLLYLLLDHHLNSTSSELRISLRDVFCKVFTKVHRTTVFRNDDDTSKTARRPLRPLRDMKMVDVSGLIDKFIRRNMMIPVEWYHDTSPPTYNPENPDGGNGGKQLCSRVDNAVKEILNKSKRGRVNESNGTSKRKSCSGDPKLKHSTFFRAEYDSCQGKTLKESLTPVTFGDTCNLRQTTILVRTKPIVPVHENHLLYPLHEADTKRILCFLRLSKQAEAQLIFPRLFNSHNTFMKTSCTWQTDHLQPQQHLQIGHSWVNLIADFTPFTHTVMTYTD